MDWRSELRDLVESLGRRARHAMDAAERVVDRDPPGLVVYRGYAAADRALVLGRALQDEGIAPADPAHGRWRNLRYALKRFESDPLPFARVRTVVGRQEVELTADDEGFIRAWVPLGDALGGSGWYPIELELLAAAGRPGPPPRARGAVLVPDPTTRFGVVSDMDDTVVQSEVTDFVRAARLVLLENARTRLPFHAWPPSIAPWRPTRSSTSPTVPGTSTT